MINDAAPVRLATHLLSLPAVIEEIHDSGLRLRHNPSCMYSQFLNFSFTFQIAIITCIGD